MTFKNNINIIKTYFTKLGVEYDETDFQKLNEDEIRLLIELCEETINYRKAFDKKLSETNSDAYNKIQEESNNKIQNLEEAYIDAKEKIREEKDEEMDKLEVDVRSQIKKIDGQYYQKIEDWKQKISAV